MGSVLAVDLGASSGRAIIGKLENGKIDLKEISKFSNKPIYKRGVMSWDIERLLKLKVWELILGA